MQLIDRIGQPTPFQRPIIAPVVRIPVSIQPGGPPAPTPIAATPHTVPITPPSAPMLTNTTPQPPVPMSTATLPPALATTVDALHEVAATAAQSGDSAAQQVAQFVGNLANQITTTAQQVQGADLVVGVTPTPAAALHGLLGNPITWLVAGGLVLLWMRKR